MVISLLLNRLWHYWHSVVVLLALSSALILPIFAQLQTSAAHYREQLSGVLLLGVFTHKLNSHFVKYWVDAHSPFFGYEQIFVAG